MNVHETVEFKIELDMLWKDSNFPRTETPGCQLRGVSRIFERGSPISLGSLKKGHQILKGGGGQWSEGGVQYICLTRTTNLAYLDAKE